MRWGISRFRVRATAPGMTVGRSHPRRLGLLDRLPDFQRRQRGVEIPDAELAERVHNAIGDAGRPADRAGFAATLGAQRIGAAGAESSSVTSIGGMSSARGTQ